MDLKAIASIWACSDSIDDHSLKESVWIYILNPSHRRASLRFAKDRKNIGCFRRFIQFSLFSNQHEVLSPLFHQLIHLIFQDYKSALLFPKLCLGETIYTHSPTASNIFISPTLPLQKLEMVFVFQVDKAPPPPPPTVPKAQNGISSIPWTWVQKATRVIWTLNTPNLVIPISLDLAVIQWPG